MSPSSSICPLYRLDDKSWPVPIGSGVLLAVGPAHFLLTCAHVLDHLDDPTTGRTSLLSVLNGDLQPFAGTGSVSRMPATGGRERDRVDVTFLRLDDATAAGFRAQFAFWPVEAVALGVEASHDTHYTFMGYPLRDAEPRGKGMLRPQIQKITARSYAEADYHRVGVMPYSHVGIVMDGAPMRDETGNVHQDRPLAPILNGLSGGGVFKGVRRRELGQDVPVELVGLCMELPPEHPQSFLAVRITAALEGIRRRFPELSPFIPETPDVRVVQREPVALSSTL